MIKVLSNLNRPIVMLMGIGIFLGACSTSPSRVSPSDKPVETTPSVQVPVDTAPAKSSPSRTPMIDDTASDSLSAAAWQALIQQADSYKQQGNLDSAIIKLEQAQHIAPNQPSIYSRLAALSFSQGHPRQAEVLALKGLSVSQSIEYTRYFWQVIAYSRQLLGDTKGHQQALDEMSQW